jgi:hypothetical protein
MEDINPDILKTDAGILRKRAWELYILEDDCELRDIFEFVGGIEAGFFFFYIISRCLDTII